MNLLVKRTKPTLISTLGELYLPDGKFHSFTLEDPIRPFKIPGKTAIPAGTYELIINWSNRFQRPMPLLLAVPFYQGIRIHSGNTTVHTEGCLLVGQKHGEDVLYQSRFAFDDLFPRLRKMLEKGKVFVEIQGGYPPDQWGPYENAKAN